MPTDEDVQVNQLVEEANYEGCIFRREPGLGIWAADCGLFIPELAIVEDSTAAIALQKGHIRHHERLHTPHGRRWSLEEYSIRNPLTHRLYLLEIFCQGESIENSDSYIL